MPRKARIDAPGALYHIICRGIERGKIFKDDIDLNSFVDRPGMSSLTVANRLGITQSAVSRLAQRGEKLAIENNLFLEE